jgi:hypothetical protein
VAVVFLGAIVATGIGCRRDVAEEPGAKATDQPRTEAAPRRLTLDTEAAERAGVRTAAVEPAEAAAEIVAFGRVLDPLPLVEALHARAAARETAALARTEYERIARLHGEDHNASTRDFENARAALAKATLDLADATARVTLAWGAASEIGDALADDLVAGRMALLRVAVPAGATVTPPPATVTVAVTGDAGDHRVARVLGPAPTTDVLVQGQSLLALLGDDPPRPGAVLSVAVPRGEHPVAGVAMPADAVVWVASEPAVYVEAAAGEFERRRVTLGPRLDSQWIVTAGITPGERVVVEGAARLLSSEVLSTEPTAD